MAKGGAAEAEARAAARAIERLARLLRAEEFSDGLVPAQREALRYLARANRFSNAPGALARYLGATKGTVSQTILALERKGLIVKTPRPGEARSVALALTEAGSAALASDPWFALEAAIRELRGKPRRRLAEAAAELRDGALARGGHESFGTCRDCRFFREDGGAQGGAHCMQFEAALRRAERDQLCAAHVPASS